MARKKSPCTVDEARQIGEVKLRISGAAFEAALKAAMAMPDRKNDDAVPIAALALAILRVARVDPRDEKFHVEFTDALRLAMRAEEEWRLEQSLGAKGRLS